MENVEGLVPNISDPITYSLSDRRGGSCVVSHVGAGRFATLTYNSFRWQSIRMYNRVSKAIRMLSSCSVVGCCVVSHVNIGRLGTLSYNSFRWRSIRMFNKLPK